MPKGATYGCADDARPPTTALKGFDVASQVAKVCVVAGDTELTCFQTQAAADAAKTRITTEPKTSARRFRLGVRLASAQPDADGGPRLDGRRVLPDRLRRRGAAVLSRLQDRAGRLQVTRHQGDRDDLVHHGTAAQDPRRLGDTDPQRLAEEVRVALAPAPRAPRTIPGTAYAELDQTGSSPLPCDSKTKQEAEQAPRGARGPAHHHALLRGQLAGTGPRLLHDPECGRGASARDRPAAPVGADRPDRSARGATDDRDRDAGRPAFQSIQSDLSDRRRARLEGVRRATPRTATRSGTRTSRATPCTSGPVTITGGNITNARAALSGGSQSVAEWLVNFELDGEGTRSSPTRPASP